MNGRLSWLTDLLSGQRATLNKLLLRLKDVGARVGTSIALHHKFMRLLEQISFDREKELDLINEIEAVEKQHQQMRQAKRLRQADRDYKPKADIDIIHPTEEKPERGGILTLFGLLLLFSNKPIKQKNQSLTVD